MSSRAGPCWVEVPSASSCTTSRSLGVRSENAPSDCGALRQLFTAEGACAVHAPLGSSPARALPKARQNFISCAVAKLMRISVLGRRST